MSKYKFKLEGLLKLRKFKEQQLKVELGRIVSEIQRVKNKISEYKGHIDEAYDGQEKVLKGETSGEMIKFFPYFVEAKNSAITFEVERLKGLEEQYEEKVIEMKKARGETKVIDKLKEKDKNLFMKDKAKKDFAKIEEMRILRQGEGS
ncbi:MAG: flagellar FliJ protein [Bacteriovoracaceae bacterium]|jgi:flagellar FliJ protein